MDETSYKSHNMIFICSDEGEWSVKVNIVNEIAYHSSKIWGLRQNKMYIGLNARYKFF